jgi:hypothetical protein
MKTLLQSIFPNSGEMRKNGITVNTFASATLLLNRCSDNSKSVYIDNVNNYKSFIDLHISSMRSYKDACALCKEFENSIDLQRHSATNLIYGRIKKRTE